MESIGGYENKATDDVAEDLVAEFEAIDEDDEYDDWEDEYWYEGDERTEELEREKQFEVLTIPQEILKDYDLPRLPEGVAIMGGTARSVARQIVAGDIEPVRDLDLVYIPELGDGIKLSDKELDDLSKEYMPDDYMYGHGIQTEELENYFLTRDFTMNQCLVYQDKLMLTRAAYDDLQENIIRPSYDTQPGAETPISERLFLKALMMKAVLATTTGSYPTLEEFGLERIDEEISAWEDGGAKIRLGAFSIALTMNKTMSRGAEVTQDFVDTLVEYGVVAEHYRGRPLLLAREARDECYNFEYRPYEDWADEEMYDSLEEEFAGLEKYQTGNRAVREAMQEYESYFQIKERRAGEYTPEEYEWVNREG